MLLERLLLCLARGFEPAGRPLLGVLDRARLPLVQAGWTVEEYSGLLAGLVFLSAWTSFSSCLFFGVWGLAGAGIMVLGLWPFCKRRFIARKVYSSVPWALLLVYALLEAGEGFEKALKGAGGPAGERLARAADRMEAGESAHSALEKERILSPCPTFSRACSELERTYYTGSTENLSSFARSVLVEQRNRIREYNSKAVMYSLFFIMCSAVLPCMFESFVTIGSSFMNVGLGPVQAVGVILAGFPAASATVMLLLLSRRPAA